MLTKININCIYTITLEFGVLLCKTNCTQDCNYIRTPDIRNMYLNGTTLKSLCSPVTVHFYNYITMDIRNSLTKSQCVP